MIFEPGAANEVVYTYTSNASLLTATSSQGLVVSIEYDSSQRAERYSMTKGTNHLGFITIEYGFFHTTFTDHLENTVRYTFDCYGHTINTLDDHGIATYYRYLNPFSRSIDYANLFLHHKLVESSLPQKTTMNPVNNHSFELDLTSNTSWDFVIDDLGGQSTNAGFIGEFSGTQKLFGDYSARINVPFVNQEAHIEQEIILDSGAYTLSGYIMNQTGSNEAYLDIVNESTLIGTVPMVSPMTAWQYVEISFEVDSNNTILEVHLVNHGVGSAYFDNIQIVEGFRDTRINRIENPSFERDTAGWTLSGATRTYDGSETQDLHDSILGDYYLLINGDADYDKYAQITLSNTGFEANSFYVFGSWAKGVVTPSKYDYQNGDDRVYGVIVELLINGVTNEELYFPYNSYVEDWQYMVNKFYVGSNITSIRIKVVFRGQGTVKVDGFQLYQEALGDEYTYDDFGNLETIKTPISDGSTVLTWEPNSRFVLDQIVDPNGLVTDPEFNSAGLFQSVTKSNVTSSVTYNTYNQVQTMTIGSPTTYYQTFLSYSSDYQYVDQVTNEFNQTVDFSTNQLNGLLSALQNERDITMSFQYDEAGRTIQVSRSSSNITYIYVDDLLDEIQVNGFSYHLEYDELDRIDEVYVNSTRLKAFTYETDVVNNVTYMSGRMSEQIFGNDDRIKFLYNDEGRVDGVSYQASGESGYTQRYAFEYNQSGDLTVLRDLRNSTTQYYRYDLTGRIRSVTDQSGSVISYEYDNAGNLHVYAYDIFYGPARSTTYTHDLVNGKYDETTFGSFAKNYNYDSSVLQRLSNIVLTYGSTTLNSITYAFFEGSEVTNGNISSRVKSITQVYGSGTYVETLEYNEQGFIKKITNQSAQIHEFIYDSKDQLIRENNQISNKTYTYSYDNYGNITSQMSYAFTTSQSLPQPSFIESYTYDSVWKDKLYQYRYYIGTTLNYTQTYAYDNAGNVISISDSRGSAYSIDFEWEGRNLTNYTQGGTLIDVEYVYNQNGIRIAKSVNGSVFSQYFVDGSRVLYETNGANDIYYTYDVDGTLISLNYNGTEYFYVYNALGDIVKLLNTSGQVVVEYRYDAYGNILYQTSGALATANPYRYRGYRYDEETKLYYLNSRYYNPQTGRFLNADGILKASDSTLGFNMFAYVENNPVVRTDPSGYCIADANGDGMNPSYRSKCGSAYDNKYNEWYVDPAFSNLSSYSIVHEYGDYRYEQTSYFLGYIGLTIVPMVFPPTAFIAGVSGTALLIVDVYRQSPDTYSILVSYSERYNMTRYTLSFFRNEISDDGIGLKEKIMYQVAFYSSGKMDGNILNQIISNHNRIFFLRETKWT
jgi:RHS repeat-associated protein